MTDKDDENEVVALPGLKFTYVEYFRREKGVSRERLNLDGQSIDILDDLERIFGSSGMDKGRSRSVRVGLKTLYAIYEKNPDFLENISERVDDL